jgi:uncharacterized protein YkwD
VGGKAMVIFMKKLKYLVSILLSFAVLSSCFIPNTYAADETRSVKFKMEYNQSEARKILPMINEMRTGEDAWYFKSDNSIFECSGLSELAYDYTLEKIAMRRAAEIALSFSHTRPNGYSCFSAYNEFGYSCSTSGENIAAGSSSAEGANLLWREDNEDYSGQGHRRNMLSADYNAVGIGHVIYNGIDYWVEEFAMSGKVDSGETTALDDEDIVGVEIADSNISKIELVKKNEKIEAKLKKEVELPEFNLNFTINGTWPSRICAAAECNADIEIVDTNIASIKDDKIYGESLGETKCVVSAFGESLSLDVNVECEHEYNAISEKSESCTEDGFIIHKCKICGDEYTETINKLGHDMVHNKKVDSDCKTEGKKEYWNCRRCKKDFFDSQGEKEVSSTEDLIIPLAEHNYVLKSEVKATCTSSGEKNYECSVCKDTYSEHIDPLGHNIVYHEAVEPSCAQKGEREHWHCTNCGIDFNDKDGEYIINEEDISLDKLEHIIESFGKTVKATHFNSGSISGTKCSVCGKVFIVPSTIPKKSFGKITLKSGKKKFTASWKKISGNSGYQIRYSAKKNLTSAKTKNIKGKKTTISKLKSKKTYYVKVRAFKKVNGIKIYSNWSKIGKVKTK